MRSVWDWYKRCPDGTLAAPYATPCSLVPHLSACLLCSTGQWAQSVEDHSLLDYRVDADGERADKGCNPDRWGRAGKPRTLQETALRRPMTNGICREFPRTKTMPISTLSSPKLTPIGRINSS